MAEAVARFVRDGLPRIRELTAQRRRTGVMAASVIGSIVCNEGEPGR